MATYITSTNASITLGPVNLDYDQSPMNVSVGVIFNSTTMTGTYGIQYTLLDQQALTAIGSTVSVAASSWAWFNDVNLPPGQTAAGTTNYMFPVAAIRCVITALSSSSMTFCVLQGSNN